MLDTLLGILFGAVIWGVIIIGSKNVEIDALKKENERLQRALDEAETNEE